MSSDISGYELMHVQTCSVYYVCIARLSRSAPRAMYYNRNIVYHYLRRYIDSGKCTISPTAARTRFHYRENPDGLVVIKFHGEYSIIVIY